MATTKHSKTIKAVWTACCDIIGEEMTLDKSANLFDLGIDSLGLAELVIQLEEIYGEGAITVDDMIADPTVAKVAAILDADKSSGDEQCATGAPAEECDTEVKNVPAGNPAVAVWQACCAITGEAMAMDVNANLFDIGVDSLGMAELVIQLEEVYGEGAITVDDIVANPIVGQIAARLPGGAVEEPAKVPVKTVATTPKPVATTPKPVLSTPAPMETPLATDATPAAVLSRLSQIESVCEELRAAVQLLTPSAVVPPTPTTEATLTSAPPPPSIAKPSPTPTAAVARAPALAATARVPAVVAAPKRDWIKTTHVGSLPRAAGEGELSAATIISQQKAIGIDVINDGEWSRDNYIADLLSRIDGIGSQGSMPAAPGCLCEMPCAADMRDVPFYAQRFTGGNGLITLNPKRVARADTACIGEPKYDVGGKASLMQNLRPFISALKEAGYETADGFWSVPSPGTLAVFCEDRYFNDHMAFVASLAEAVRAEYEAIASTGLQLQIDCPDLAMGRHTRHVDLSEEQFAAVCEANVAALNSALRSIDASQVRVHICWGNYAGPHHHDIAARSVWPAVSRINCKYILIEAANPRHGHEVAAFEEACASGLFDKSKVIVPGVIDTTAARVEHPALVAERLLRFVRAVGHPSRVIASTDCGFASTARSVAITADLAWRKMGALVEGAALATKLYLEASAPVPMAAPVLAPTPFRAAIFVSAADAAAGRALASELAALRVSTVDVLPSDGALSGRAAEAFAALRSAVDFPLALIAVGGGAAGAVATKAAELLGADGSASRRPSTVFACAGATAAGAVDAASADMVGVAALVQRTMLAGTGFDKRALAPARNEAPLPSSVDVVVVGGGLLGMVQAKRLLDAGCSVAVLEQRTLVGGIWSMYANSTSQVNSSEGGYCFKELLPEDSPRRHAHNRDHSTAAEVLADMAELGKSLAHVIYTSTQVVRVLGKDGDYQVVAMQHNLRGTGATGASAASAIIEAKGVVMAINDRVGMPRPLSVPGMDAFRAGGGVVGDGTSDALRGVDWRGKRVAIFGMGAFAVENVRTALEHGAAHVTVVARRLGTICPKMIDYLNFVKPWDAQYRHDTTSNVKQMKCWRGVYKQSGATQPEVWPTKVKHDGHTISVSDIWFIGHHLGMLATKIGTLEAMEHGGCVLSDGSFLPADIVVGCIGFERNTTFCEQLTGRTVVKHSNYLDKNLMYLADAEIDEGAFNSFFGSSVLEYAKFYTRVFVEGFLRPDDLGHMLWSESVPSCPVKERKWMQYIGVGLNLIAADPTIDQAVKDQVRTRTEHFYRTMPPQTFLDVNRREWEELHTRLNGGVPLPAAKMLPYPFPDAPSWCAPVDEVLGSA